MKHLIFIIAVLFATSSVSAQERLTQKEKNTLLDWDVTAGGTVRSPDEKNFDMSALTFDLKNIGLVVIEEKNGFDVALGKFRIEVDVYGSNTPEGATAVDVRTLTAGFVNAVYSKPNAILGVEVKAFDFSYEKIDQHISVSSMTAAGSKVELKPLQRTNSPIKLLIVGELNLRLITSINNSDPLVAGKISQAITALTQGDWRAKVQEGSFKGWAMFFNTKYGATVGYKNWFELESNVANNEVADYRLYDVEIAGEKPNLNETYGHSIKRTSHELRVPLFKGGAISLVARYSQDKMNIRTGINSLDCKETDSCHSYRHQFASEGNLMTYIPVPFEVRKNKSTFVGIRVRF